MGQVPEYVEDYLKLIENALQKKYNLSASGARQAVQESAVRSILCGDNEAMRQYQMHQDLDKTVDDVFKQFKYNPGDQAPRKDNR